MSQERYDEYCDSEEWNDGDGKLKVKSQVMQSGTVGHVKDERFGKGSHCSCSL